VFKNLIDKLFLIKEIRSREGVVHFKRWRLLATPFMSIYIHYIPKSDEDTDPHDHPWDFLSIGLKGILREYNKEGELSPKRRMGSFSCMKTSEFHRNIVIEPFWSLVFVGRRKHDRWGFWTSEGWVDFEAYRKQKNNRKEVGIT